MCLRKTGMCLGRVTRSVCRKYGGLGLRAALFTSAAAFVGAVALVVGQMSDAQRALLVNARGVVQDGLSEALRDLAARGTKSVLFQPTDLGGRPPTRKQCVQVGAHAPSCPATARF